MAFQPIISRFTQWVIQAHKMFNNLKLHNPGSVAYSNIVELRSNEQGIFRILTALVGMGLKWDRSTSDSLCVYIF
jgi:hypothetical protein